MHETVVITGANRGIGLSLCRYYQQQGKQVYGICRQPSPALESLQVTIIGNTDVSQAEDIEWLGDALKGVEIDILINNAGILQDEILGNLDFSSIQKQFEVNSLGPLRVTETLLKNLHRGSKIAFITSRMGSITDNTSGGRYGYRMSKCALNIAAVSVAHDLKSKGISVGILHPGLVGTDMIGGQGNLTPDQAASLLGERIDALTPETSGTFWHSSGEVLPW